MRGVQAIESVQIWRAEQEEDDDWKAQKAGNERRCEDSASRCYAGVLCLLANVATRLVANEDSSSDEVTEHPVPNRRRSSIVIRLSEDELGRLEAVALTHCDRQPDEVEEKVEHDDTNGQTEDHFVSLRVQVVHSNADEKKCLR